ncbi:MAG: hypothetical protein QOI92_617 [Chloroflexota bacterium]|jgi:hypothetical protein|nr:hypothetical protein [Chloroflexota bacterium]
MSTLADDDHPSATAAGVPRWPAIVALFFVGGLLALVSSELTVGPSWLPLLVIAALTIPITIASRRESHVWRRRMAFVGLGTVTLAVVGSAVLLVERLLSPGGVDPGPLLFGAGAIWLANCGTFAVWYWEIDGGGPGKRRRDGHVSSDFLFPQLQVGDGTSSGGWWPGFLDYLFVAWNASTAFSPTDTLILTRRAKVLMMIQSLIALVTVAVLAARAINTLK